MTKDNKQQKLSDSTDTAIDYSTCYRLPFLSLFHADCMEIMKQYPDKYFDLAICDPPYGIGVSEMNIGARKVKNKACDSKGWDSHIPTQEYFKELQRVSKNQIIWGANYFNCFNGKNGAIIWNKNNPLPTSSDCEIASYSKHSKVAIFNKTWTNYVNDKETNHPTEKPITLYSWIIQQYTEIGFKLLDTHFGSGSIALAVDKANRLDKMNLHLTACEIDKEYIDKAIKRISESIKQGTLSF